MTLSSKERIAADEHLTGQTLYGYLGGGPGQDGFVRESSDSTAVKFFDRQDRFLRERDVYRDLRSLRLRKVDNFWIPRLLDDLEDLLILELTQVRRPFVLDFAGAKLEHEIPDFSEDVMADHHAHLEELFGDKWTEALAVAESFRVATGYTLLDIHPGNIAFADE